MQGKERRSLLPHAILVLYFIIPWHPRAATALALSDPDASVAEFLLLE